MIYKRIKIKKNMLTTNKYFDKIKYTDIQTQVGWDPILIELQVSTCTIDTW